jgi:hypothetical protein
MLTKFINCVMTRIRGLRFSKCKVFLRCVLHGELHYHSKCKMLVHCHLNCDPEQRVPRLLDLPCRLTHES